MRQLQPRALCLQMLLPVDRWPLAASWIAFLESGAGGGKPPSRDSWCMLIELFQTVKPDMSDYDASGASEGGGRWCCRWDSLYRVHGCALRSFFSPLQHRGLSCWTSLQSGFVRATLPRGDSSP